jgi:hypothetical protein
MVGRVKDVLYVEECSVALLCEYGVRKPCETAGKGNLQTESLCRPRILHEVIQREVQGSAMRSQFNLTFCMGMNVLVSP